MNKYSLMAAVCSSFLPVSFARATDAHDQLSRAIAGTKITLDQAVDAAQKKVRGSRVLDAGLEWTAKSPHYEVSLLSGAAVQIVWVDPVSGTASTADDAKRAERGSEERKACIAAKVTPQQALKTAGESLGKGPLIGIEMLMYQGKPAYEVAGLINNKVMKVRIDAVAVQASTPRLEHFPIAYWLFDEDEPGKPPADFQFAETHPGKTPGTWNVTADPAAVSGPNVLSLQTSETESTFNLAMVKNSAYEDLDLRVRLRANTGKEDQGGGLIWRFKDPNNYYICRLNPLESNFRVYKVVDGKRIQLQSVEFIANAGKWYRLRIVMTGNRIACLLDEKKLLEVHDTAIKGPGMIGLWTKADASSSFDNLVVYPPLLPD